ASGPLPLHDEQLTARRVCPVAAGSANSASQEARDGARAAGESEAEQTDRTPIVVEANSQEAGRPRERILTAPGAAARNPSGEGYRGKIFRPLNGPIPDETVMSRFLSVCQDLTGFCGGRPPRKHGTDLP